MSGAQEQAGRQLPFFYYEIVMSFIKELERLQQNIKELSQAFEALKEASERSSPPEHPNELREPEPYTRRLNDATPAEWDQVSKRFYTKPKKD